MDQKEKIKEVFDASPAIAIHPTERIVDWLYDHGVRVIPEELQYERFTARENGEPYFPYCISGECAGEHCRDGMCTFIDEEVCERLAEFEDVVDGKKTGNETGDTVLECGFKFEHAVIALEDAFDCAARQIDRISVLDREKAHALKSKLGGRLKKAMEELAFVGGGDGDNDKDART